jgi:hypothetical protein
MNIPYGYITSINPAKLYSSIDGTAVSRGVDQSVQETLMKSFLELMVMER